MGKLSLTEEVMRSRQLLNSYLILVPKSKLYESQAIKSLLVLLSSIRRGKMPKDAIAHLSKAINGIDDVAPYLYRRAFKLKELPYSLKQGGWSLLQGNEKRFAAFEVWAAIEQIPHPDLRVMLGDDRDRLGLRKLQPLCWRWHDLEIESLVRLQELFAQEIARARLGQFQSWLELDGCIKPRCNGGNHHMGTTRMHIDPQQGVVDENCRVHGISNLFIAGSSVFPTGGAANPTLTIVALAIRLADRIKQVLASEALAIGNSKSLYV
jgi:choline dehydrogenase-like flavoprotein